MNNTKRWGISVWSRFVGIMFWTAFILFTIEARDIWSHAIIQVILVLLTIICIMIIPDNIIFGKYLVKRRNLNQSRSGK